MKFIITESKIEKMIFKYLNNLNLVKIERGINVYFAKSKDDNLAEIRYNKNNGYCDIYHNMIDEISTFFSLDNLQCKEIIGKWVEEDLQMKVTKTLFMSDKIREWLTIPSK